MNLATSPQFKGGDLFGVDDLGIATAQAAALVKGVSFCLGRITVGGQDIVGVKGQALRDFRRGDSVQHVFQDPLQSIDAALPVGRSIVEGLVLRGGLDRTAIEVRVAQALNQVSVSSELAEQYPVRCPAANADAYCWREHCCLIQSCFCSTNR